MSQEIRIDLGRFTEFPTADAGGMERRAFGEFTGSGGELASYALGWRSDADPRSGRLTIGIGAGNPGGGTFHAAVYPHKGHYAFNLLDEPFEDVPEGGPHLDAATAREHPDLPFIWWVADYIFTRDCRARWMEHWVVETRAISTVEVFKRHEPVLLVFNDADDDLWQLIGATDAGPEGRIGHLHHAVDEDPSLQEVLDLLPGEEALRSGPGAPWTRGRTPEET